MIKSKWKEFAFIFVIIGSVQYIILTALAMYFYTGGTLSNPKSPGYNFWGNLFSDLSRTKALSGKSNFISCVITTIAGCILACSLLVFVLIFPSFFKDKNREKQLSNAVIIIGIITVILMFITFLTPWDIYKSIHIIFAVSYSVCGIFVLIICSAIIYMNENYPNIYAHNLVSYSIVAIVYTLLLIASPNLITTESLLFHATMQKISMYMFLTCFIIQGYGAWRMERIKVQY